jgi:hypothetical protein
MNVLDTSLRTPGKFGIDTAISSGGTAEKTHQESGRPSR